MRVLCITTSFSSDKSIILVKRGCTYNVTRVVKSKYHRQCKTDIWYELLETGNDLHIGTLFVLLPEEIETSIKPKSNNQ